VLAITFSSFFIYFYISPFVYVYVYIETQGILFAISLARAAGLVVGPVKYSFVFFCLSITNVLARDHTPTTIFAATFGQHSWSLDNSLGEKRPGQK